MQVNELYAFFFNFNSERDSLDRDVMELKKSNTLLDAALKAKSDSLIDLQKKVYCTSAEYHIHDIYFYPLTWWNPEFDIKDQY